MEFTAQPSLIIDVRRCYDCGRWWGLEKGHSGWCPKCANEAIDQANARADRAERQMRGLRGALTRKGRRS